VYTHTSKNPSLGMRRVSVLANDSALVSELRRTTIAVLGVNDSPVLTLSGSVGRVVFRERTRVPVAIRGSATFLVGDVDDTHLVSGVVRLLQVRDEGAEVLSAQTDGTNITAAFQSNVLVLTGRAPLVDYARVLNSVVYANQKNDSQLRVGARVLEVEVFDGTQSSNALSLVLEVEAVNTAPVLDLNGPGSAGTSYEAVLLASQATAVDGRMTLIDTDSECIVSASATILNMESPGLEGMFAETAGTSISIVYSSSEGVLRLSGCAPPSDYERVIRTVTYYHDLANPDLTTREVEFVAFDGIALSQPVRSFVIFGGDRRKRRGGL
jgi:hypothetical protein